MNSLYFEVFYVGECLITHGCILNIRHDCFLCSLRGDWLKSIKSCKEKVTEGSTPQRVARNCIKNLRVRCSDNSVIKYLSFT